MSRVGGRTILRFARQFTPNYQEHSLPLVLSRYAHLLETANGEALGFNSLTMKSWLLRHRDLGVINRAPVEACADTAELEAAGLLVPSDEDRPGQAITQLRNHRSMKTSGHFRALRLAVTERCNMACTYCFQQALYPDALPRMTLATMTRTIEWFIDQAKGDEVSVQFFGGEPLLEFALIEEATRLLEEATECGRIAAAHLSMTTNGTILTDSMAAWLSDHRFRLIFSFDGPPDENDLNRVFRSGRGTFHAAMAGAQRWTACGEPFELLMTATNRNLHRLLDHARWFVEKSGLRPTVVGLNSPQPTQQGWETGGEDLAGAVFATWQYLASQAIEFHGPGLHIPNHLGTGIPQSDHCIDDGLFDLDEESGWPIYVSANGQRSMCLVHNNDQRVTLTDASQPVEWHRGQPDIEECDSCIASQTCGGPCALERLLWSAKLSSDRCDFMRAMTILVATQG